MNVIAPDLDIVSLFLGPFNPGDEIIENPYTGKRSVYRKSSGSWQGTIRYGTLDVDAEKYATNRKKLLGFHSALDGFNNIVKLRLSNDYQNNREIPDNANFRVNAVANDGITITLTNAGMFEPAQYDYFNSDDRLYMIKSASAGKYIIRPEGVLKANDILTFNDVFVMAKIDGTAPIGRQGNQLIAHTFSFWEDLT